MRRDAVGVGVGAANSFNSSLAGTGPLGGTVARPSKAARDAAIGDAPPGAPGTATTGTCRLVRIFVTSASEKSRICTSAPAGDDDTIIPRSATGAPPGGTTASSNGASGAGRSTPAMSSAPFDRNCSTCWAKSSSDANPTCPRSHLAARMVRSYSMRKWCSGRTLARVRDATRRSSERRGTASSGARTAAAFGSIPRRSAACSAT